MAPNVSVLAREFRALHPQWSLKYMRLYGYAEKLNILTIPMTTSPAPNRIQQMLASPGWLTAERVGLFLIALVAALASIYQGSVAQSALTATLVESNRIAKADELSKRQQIIVYQLIRKSPQGVTFDSLLTNYRQHPGLDDLELPKEELKPYALEKILLDLEMIGLVFWTLDGKYMAQHSVVNPRFANVFAVQEAKYAIVSDLMTSSGTLTPAELLQKLNLAGDDAEVALSELAAGKLIVLDEAGRVHSNLKVPAKSLDKSSDGTK